jgi:hypothetical protein
VGLREIGFNGASFERKEINQFFPFSLFAGNIELHVFSRAVNAHVSLRYMPVHHNNTKLPVATWYQREIGEETSLCTY